MTKLAKFGIALLTATAIAANEISRAHGWGNVDWVPVATAYAGALAVYAYPNVPTPPKP